MLELSRVVRKMAFCICENKDADQLRGYREANQRLCFRNTDSSIPLLPKSEISSVQPSSVVVRRTWSETPKTGFLTTRLNWSQETKGRLAHQSYTFFTSWLLEPRFEKTGLRGFRPGPTQTGLYNHKRQLEISDL